MRAPLGWLLLNTMLAFGCFGPAGEACPPDGSAAVGRTSDGDLEVPFGAPRAAGRESRESIPASRPLGGSPALRISYRVAGDATPMPSVKITAIQCLSAADPSISVPDGVTDRDGALTFPCPSSHPRVSGRAKLASAFVSITDGSGHPVSLAFDLPAADGELEFSVAAGRAYNAINYGGPIAALRFGVSRGPVGVELDAPGLPALGARYAPDHDRIEATSAAIDSYPFEEAFFKVLHEYGHAFHYVAIEPWGSYSCRNGTHAFEVENTLSCAFVEGFAHFFAAWIGGSRLDSDEALPNEASDRVLEENLYRGRLSDGARTPGVVAALLYDLADGADSPDGPGNTANGDDDPISVSGADLVSLIRGCRLVPPSGCPVVDRLDGVDQLIACAEGVPAASRAGVRWRSYRTVESPVAPIGGDRAALRSLWLRDLYGVN